MVLLVLPFSFIILLHMIPRALPCIYVNISSSNKTSIMVSLLNTTFICKWSDYNFGIQRERKRAEGEGWGGQIPPVFQAQQQHMALVVCLQMHEKRQEHRQPAMFL
jgi:hypothetical protein